MSIQKINSNTLADGAALNSIPGGVNFRNRIINGDMRIAQRGTAAVTANGAFPVDRFFAFNSTDGAFSAQQNSSAPAGFINSLKFTSTTADATLTTTQTIGIQQHIEGTNVADLGWGTANAQPVALSFWVRSSVTGDFGGAMRNNAGDRSYPFTYNISSIDTWEYKTITIPGDTSGTWEITTARGISVAFGLGSGPDRSGTAGEWAGSSIVQPTGTVSVIGTLNATWQITGVQLEAGSVATPFERRPFGAELALCQRYFQKLGLVANQMLGSGITQTGSQGTIYCKYTTTMRASPTATFSNLSVGDAFNYGRTVTTLAGSSFGVDSAQIVAGIAQSDMTAQRAMIMQCGGSTSFIDFSAEL